MNVGKSIVDDENIEFCKKIIDLYSNKIALPVDIVTHNNEIKNIFALEEEDIGFDIGPKTIELYQNYLSGAKRVVVNGPMGVFEDERFAKGTKELYEYLKEHNIKTLIGGGDSAASVNILGYSDAFFHISTGGGATLDYLSGKDLPGITEINEK
jgi:phosphoglycerate kinase